MCFQMNVFSIPQSVTRPVVLAPLCHAHLLTSQFQTNPAGIKGPIQAMAQLSPPETNGNTATVYNRDCQNPTIIPYAAFSKPYF